MMTLSLRVAACAFCLMACGVLTTGCSTVAMNWPQHRNNMDRAIDLNLRQIPDDLDRSVFLLDRPTRLSRYPIP